MGLAGAGPLGCVIMERRSPGSGRARPEDWDTGAVRFKDSGDKIVPDDGPMCRRKIMTNSMFTHMIATAFLYPP